jgi:hypothetical protein
MASAKPADEKLYASVRDGVRRDAKSRWPSAYLSALVVRKYKDAMKKKGKRPYVESSVTRKRAALTRWFDEKWIDVSSGRECGSVKRAGYYPTCRPSVRVTRGTPVTFSELKRVQIKRMVSEKQRVGKKTAAYGFSKIK